MFWHGEWTVKTSREGYMGHGLAQDGVPLELSAGEIGETLLNKYNELAGLIETDISQRSGGQIGISLSVGVGDAPEAQAERRDTIRGMQVEVWSLRSDALDRLYAARGRARP